MGRLTIMGSGELAPGMVRVHRSALAEYENPRVVILDSPFGFQENADELTDKLVDFFETSLVVSPDVASLRAPDDGLEAVRARQALDGADVIFSGPGSPSYALRVWKESALVDSIRSAANRRSLTFASAAACTLGRWSIPVYEIYKVGEDPFLDDGLDAFRLDGLPVIVVPHFDNREGGTHDTSHCYIGERRFNLVRRHLPAHVVVGVDEHTAAAFDLDAGTVEVTGRGSLHLHGDTRRALGPGRHEVGDLQAARAGKTTEQVQAVVSDVDRLLTEITDATGPGDAERAAVQLAELADNTFDLRSSIEPFVDMLLELRTTFRESGRYSDADDIRDRLFGAGIVVRDTPHGVQWTITQSTERPSS